MLFEKASSPPDPAAPARASRATIVHTRFALVLGFGVLLTLLVVSGLNTVRALSRLQSSNQHILLEYLRRANALDELRSAIYLSGTWVRDYLLEPDAARAEQSRLALADARQRIQKTVASVAAGPEEPGQPMYGDLRREVQEYWQALDPVLNWSVAERHRKGYRFLHDEVLPRRSGMLSIADTIASVNQQQLMERDNRLVEMFSGFREQSMAAVAAMFLCGLALAFVVTWQILRLEGQTMAHLREVTDARQELRSLSARLVEIQENERKNISRELHDAVGQSLSAIQFELHNLSLALEPYPPALVSRVASIRDLVEHSVAMVRDMALLLRPSMLDDLGLLPALEWQARQIGRATGVRIEISGSLPAELPEEHKLCIFRLVQEALNNVSRHAHASWAEIVLASADRRVSVLVRDNGRGFDPRPGTGLGLIGMQERVKGLGGTLRINSQLGKGTSIEASLPLPWSVAATEPVAPDESGSDEPDSVPFRTISSS